LFSGFFKWFWCWFHALLFSTHAGAENHGCLLLITVFPAAAWIVSFKLSSPNFFKLLEFSLLLGLPFFQDSFLTASFFKEALAWPFQANIDQIDKTNHWSKTAADMKVIYLHKNTLWIFQIFRQYTKNQESEEK